MLVNVLQCPSCQQSFSHSQLIVHLKQEHNIACTRLIDFFDPRYYLLLISLVLKEDLPFKKELIFAIRDSDNVLTTQRKSDSDLELRKMAFAFQRKRALQQNYFETQSRSFLHKCILCDESLTNITRQNAIEHYEQHGLKIGGVEGIVYIEKFLMELQKQISQLICPYCEQQFRGQRELKYHLKQKGHLRFNQKRNDIDHFFLTNYRQYGKSWRYKDLSDDDCEDIEQPQIINQEEECTDEECDCILNKYQLQLEQIPHADLSYTKQDEKSCKCIFCQYLTLDTTDIKQHIQVSHQFNMNRIYNLTDVYQRIMQINYFRQKIDLSQCPLCDKIFSSDAQAEKHYQNMTHGEIKILTDQCYLLPFFEDDPLLIDVIDEE